MPVVQDTLDMVSPLRVDTHPVNKPFRRPAAPNKEHMLLIVTVGAQGPQEHADPDPLCFQKDNIHPKEYKQHLCGEIIKMIDKASQAEQQEGKEHKPDHIGLADIGKFGPPPLDPLGNVEVKAAIQDQVDRYNENWSHKIHLRLQHSLCHWKYPSAYNNEPGQSIGSHGHCGIQKHMDPVQPFLVIFDHFISP